jgi:hypothetical protein
MVVHFLCTDRDVSEANHTVINRNSSGSAFSGCTTKCTTDGKSEKEKW